MEVRVDDEPATVVRDGDVQAARSVPDLQSNRARVCVSHHVRHGFAHDA
jgi:hypothetical protein